MLARRIVSVCLLPLIAGALPAQSTVRLSPIADATIRSDQPSSNYGSATELGLAKSQNAASQTYFMRTHFRFDLTSLNGKAVHSAALYFYENRTAGAGGLPVSLYRLTQGFAESTITWNNKPSDDNKVIATVKVGDNFNRGWKKFDVTQLVIDWVRGTQTNHGMSIRLARESTAGARRPGWGPSREFATASLRPYLEVDTTAFRTFDRGCGPVATWPRLAVTKGTPRINTQMTVQGSLLAVNSLSITAIGLSNTTWNGVKLPYVLDARPFPPCQLLVALDLQLSGRTTQTGQQTWTFQVPNDRTAIGFKVYLQMATFGTAVHMTEGLELMIH